MTKHATRPVRSCIDFATFVLFATCVVLYSGCSRSGGLSDFEKAQKKKDSAADSLRALGAEVSPVTYPNYGEGWAVKLRGAKITTEMFDQMKALKRVSDLDVSKSDITDEQLAKLSEQDVGTMIVKLNLSNTSITDAGVDNLKLPLLTHFTVTGTKISNAAIDRLKQRRASDPRLPTFKVVK
jgi:hypothetical protein